MNNIPNRIVIIIAILVTITRIFECLAIYAIYCYVIAGNDYFSQIVAYLFIGVLHLEINKYIKKGRQNIIQNIKE